MAVVTVHALEAGYLSLPEKNFVEPNDPSADRQAPSLCFLVQHHSPQSDKAVRILFDLGLRRDVDLYPPALEEHRKIRGLKSARPDILESLAVGGLTPEDIDYIIISHVHYDHVGYPRDFDSAQTKFIIGPGAADVLSGKVKFLGNHSIFEPDLFPPDRTIELPPVERPWNYIDNPLISETSLNLSTWRPLPPFAAALDLFGDATVYIINAPGHLPGHINLLCRLSPPISSTTTSATPNNPSKLTYALLAGDSAHDQRLIDGTHQIATWEDENGQTICIHTDKTLAEQTITKIKKVNDHGIELILDEDDPCAAIAFADINNDNNENKGIGKFMTTADSYIEIQRGWYGDPRAQEVGRMDSPSTHDPPQQSGNTIAVASAAEGADTIVAYPPTSMTAPPTTISATPSSTTTTTTATTNTTEPKRKVKVRADVELIFAHDDVWEANAKKRGRFWPGQL